MKFLDHNSYISFSSIKILAVNIKVPEVLFIKIIVIKRMFPCDGLQHLVVAGVVTREVQTTQTSLLGDDEVSTRSLEQWLQLSWLGLTSAISPGSLLRHH